MDSIPEKIFKPAKAEIIGAILSFPLAFLIRIVISPNYGLTENAPESAANIYRSIHSHIFRFRGDFLPQTESVKGKLYLVGLRSGHSGFDAPW